MVSAKPLHVQVAEALGCTPEPDQRGNLCCWHDDSPHARSNWSEFGNAYVAEYDTDWGATGPLIERYGITLIREGYKEPLYDWVAYYRYVQTEDSGNDRECEADGPTALVAACNLILALHAAGKLHAQEPAAASR